MGVTAAIVGIAGAGASMYGASKQSKAVEKAAQSTENWQKYLVAFEERKYDDAAKFRDLAYKEASMKVGAMGTTMETALPLLQKYAAYAQSEPGMSPAYQAALRRGTESLMSNLAPYGLTNSSVTGKAMGELTGSLLSSDWQNILNAQQGFAGYFTGQSPTGVSPQTGYPNMGEASQAQGNYADLLTTQGAVQGGLYGSLGQTATQLPMYYQMMNMMNPVSSGMSGAQGAGLQNFANSFVGDIRGGY